MSILLSIKFWTGIGLGLLVAGAWGLFIHGPAEYKQGGIAKAVELNAATKEAIKELSDEAERNRFARRLCIERGGVYTFANGKCLEGGAE